MDLAKLSPGPFSDIGESDMGESDMGESDIGESLSESPKTKRSLNPTTNGSNDTDPYGPNDTGPNGSITNDFESAKKKTRSSSVLRYSQTSDHKPVYMEFCLDGINENETLVALTYNMSFASDLGIAVGSEADFVERAINANRSKPRAYWINAANLVKYFVYEKRPTIMYFQEMNDRNQIFTTFEGGYQALLELLAKPQTISPPITTLYSPLPGSYSTTGTYQGIDNKNYCYLAYSLYVYTAATGEYYPTLLTIWDADALGGLSGFYGNDLGLHQIYKFPDGNTIDRNLGRNFSCVITTKGVILINLHGPNVEDNMLINDTKLKPVIEDYLSQAYIALGNIPQLSFDKKLVVIGGDTNDTKDVVKQITFGNITYNYMGNAPFSCCAEVFNVGGRNDTLNKDYIHMGDKFWVFNPNPYPEYVNVLYEPPPGVIYGGRRHSRNLKKKNLLKKRKTIKKRHYKLKNKKSLNKRRIFRRKTRKHTHKQ